MDIEYLSSKDGNKTIKINNRFLHSFYNPIKEAELFVNNLNFSINPSVILIIEPGYGYQLKFLRQKYPDIKIGCIRINNLFDNYNKDWDFVVPFDINKDSISIEKYLSDEEICSAVFIPWKPSEVIFVNYFSNIWNCIKKTVEYSRTVLITREYFEKKWLINICNFISYAKNFVQINKIDLPIVITASGTSLDNALNIIKKNRNNLFLIALSSSISVLQNNKIQPDLSFSTDGGFWASYHLRNLETINSDDTLALSIEGYCQKKILSEETILPLVYSDGLCAEIISKLKLPFTIITRNGTVSGSALKFAQNLSDKPIFFCGLDLSPSSGYQHSQPNFLEINSSIQDFRINTKESRITKSRFNSSSLEIYRQWFSKQTDTKNIFRVIDFKQDPLGTITDISSNQMNEMLQKTITNIDSFHAFTQIDSKQFLSEIKRKEIFNYIVSNIHSNTWQKQLFPLDYTALHNSKSSEQKNNLQKQIEAKTNKLINRISIIFSNSL